MKPAVSGRPNLLAGEDLPPEPLQKRSREKRARLQAAALTQFGKRGYEGTAIDDIARHAGLAVGSFYQHYRSKRQLLLALMDDLLHRLSRLELRPGNSRNAREALRELLARAFAHDLAYLGAYRAWQEAVLSDSELARKQQRIHAWTTARIVAVFHSLQELPGARPGVDIPALARVMDSFFWSLLAQAVRMPRPELEQSIDVSVHLIYHALFTDDPRRRRQKSDSAQRRSRS